MTNDNYTSWWLSTAKATIDTLENFEYKTTNRAKTLLQSNVTSETMSQVYLLMSNKLEAIEAYAGNILT
jgi:hypothetical protein